MLPLSNTFWTGYYSGLQTNEQPGVIKYACPDSPSTVTVRRPYRNHWIEPSRPGPAAGGR